MRCELFHFSDFRHFYFRSYPDDHMAKLYRHCWSRHQVGRISVLSTKFYAVTVLPENYIYKRQFYTLSKKDATSSCLVTSTFIKWLLVSLAICSPAVSFRPQKTTFSLGYRHWLWMFSFTSKPSLANLSTKPRPRPDVPPVIAATSFIFLLDFFSNFSKSGFLVSRFC